MAEKKLVVSLSLKASNYKSEVTAIKKETQKLTSEFDKAAAGSTGLTKVLKEQEAKFNKIAVELEKNKALLNTYSKQLEKSKATLKDANAAFETQEEKVKSLRNQLASASAVYGENSKEVKILATELKAAEKTLSTKQRAVESATNSMLHMETQINNTEAKIKELNTTLAGADWSKFGATAESLGNSITKAGDGITGVGQKMSVASVGIVGALTGAAKVSIDFEKAMSKVQSTSGATAEDIEILSKHAEQLGRDIKSASATEIAQSYDYLALAGYKTNEMLAAMEPLVKANIAFGGDMATTADLMTDSLSALQMSADDASYYLDVIAQTSRNANTSGTELMEAYIEVGGTLSKLNIPLEESAKILGVLADSGLKGSEAGRSLQSVLINLMGTTSTTQGALQTLGVEVYDSEGKFRGLSTVLGEVIESSSQMTDEQSDMTLALLGGKTQLTALNNMLKSTDESYQDLEEAIKNSNGAVEEMYQIMSDNTAGTFADLSSKVETVAKQFGDLLLPIINKVVDGIIKFMDFLAGLSTEMQTTILVVGGVVAAIGPLLVIIGTLISNLGVIISTIGAVSTAIGSAGGIMAFFASSMLPVIATIGGVIAIAIALAMAIKENWEGIKEATNSLIETCKPYFEQFKESFSELWQTCQSIYETVIKPLFQIIGEIIAECINYVSPILNSLMVVFSAVFNSISAVWTSIGKPVFTFIMDIVQRMWGVFQPIFNNISSLFNSVVSAISSVWNGMGAPIFNAIINIIRNVSSVVGPAFSTFKNAIVNAMNAVLSPIQWVIDKLSTLLGWISDVGGKIGNFISNLNPFKNLFGREANVDVNYNDVSPALSGEYYQPDTIKSRSIEGLTNVVGRINTQNTTKANEQAQQIDFNQLKDTIAQSIEEGLKGIILQANVNSYLDGEQLANSLEIAQGRNLSLYGRFNG